jgi:hypothetical protein
MNRFFVLQIIEFKVRFGTDSLQDKLHKKEQFPHFWLKWQVTNMI